MSEANSVTTNEVVQRIAGIILSDRQYADGYETVWDKEGGARIDNSNDFSLDIVTAYSPESGSHNPTHFRITVERLGHEVSGIFVPKGHHIAVVKDEP